MSEIYGGVLSENAIESSLPIFSEADPASWKSYWHKEFTQKQISLVIVFSTAQIISLYGYCMRMGINLPKDLSLISIGDEPLLDWFSPRPTSLQSPEKKIISDFKSWVRDGCPRREHTYIDLAWHHGETLIKIPAPTT